MTSRRPPAAGPRSRGLPGARLAAAGAAQTIQVMWFLTPCCVAINWLLQQHWSIVQKATKSHAGTGEAVRVCKTYVLYFAKYRTSGPCKLFEILESGRRLGRDSRNAGSPETEEDGEPTLPHRAPVPHSKKQQQRLQAFCCNYSSC